MAYSCVYPTGYTLTADEQARYAVGKRFTSLALWEAQNLSLTEDEVCEIIGGDATVNWGTVGADTTPVNVLGWTTSATARIKIRTIDNARHIGSWTPVAFRLVMGVWHIPFRTECDYVFIDGLQCIAGTSAPAAILIGAYDGSTNNCGVDGCIAIAGATNEAAIELSGGSAHRVTNNICVSSSGCPSGILSFWTSDITSLSNTIYGFNVGYDKRNGAGDLVLNNLIFACATCFAGSYSTGSDYNFSSDATAPGSNSLINQTTNPFVDSSNGNYHLAARSAPIGAGIGPGADSTIPTTDIDGDTRSGATTDIGADLYVAAGGVITAMITEALAITETAGRRAIFRSTVTESVGLGDSGVSLATLAAEISESAHITGVTLAVRHMPGVIADSMVINGSIAASAVLAAMISDGVYASDTAAVAARFGVTVSDGIALSSGATYGAIITALIMDALGMGDQVSARAALKSRVTDTFALTDASSGAAIRRCIVLDGLSLTSAATLGGVISALISDGLALADGASAHATFHIAAGDSLAFADTLATVSRLIAGVVESLHLADAAIDTTVMPSGLITITLSGRGSRISFEMTGPKITITKN